MKERKWGNQVHCADQKKHGSDRKEIVTTNKMFIEYYKGLGIFATEEEWNTFWGACHDPLPTNFRITSSSPYYQHIRTRLRDYFSLKLNGIELDDGRKPETVSPLPWYRGELGWSYSLSRNDIRKNRSIDALQDFHYFLTTQTENGLLSRQEAVSMLPPLLLRVEPHHSVLDMCAAPGSKTCQIIELLDQDPNCRPSSLFFILL